MKRIAGVTAALMVSALTLLGCATESGQSGSGWITLIDGDRGMENFYPLGTSNWSAADGVIQADRKTAKEASFLVSKNSYRDFQIRVEFWASDNANSGIFMRCQNPKALADTTCYEANIFDQRPDPSFGTGGIVHHAKVSPMPKAGGKWNVYEITTRGRQIVVVLNGVKTAEFNEAAFESGPIGLQHGAGVIKFRKVQIKPL